MRRGIDQDRLGLDDLAPEPHHRAGRPVPAVRQLAHVDDAAPEAVGPGRAESRIVGSREGMAAGEPGGQPRLGSAGHDRLL